MLEITVLMIYFFRFLNYFPNTWSQNAKVKVQNSKVICNVDKPENNCLDFLNRNIIKCSKLQYEISQVQWSLHFKPTHSARKIWS